MSPSNRPVLLVTAVLPCLLVAAGAWVVVPQFGAVFVNFGAELPLATIVLLATYRWWALSALLPVGVWLGWPPGSDRAAASILAGALLAGFLTAAGLYACYAPIFALAATVG